MGKRKDRILAAISNAGRRVKLDLSTEPSGDLGGYSVHDDVGKDTESKERAGLPNSPSSSGQQQQNPLQLLGQYSDDEMEEESNERRKQAVAENSANDNENLGPCGERSEDKDANTGDDLAAQEVGQHDEEGYVISPHDLQKPEGVGSAESVATASVHLPAEMNLSGQASAAGTPATQVIVDVSSGWKMVLHEDSNQYYYWNIETGETSWEGPQALAQTTELTVDQRATIIENTQSTAGATNESNLTMGVVLDYYLTAPVDGSMDANMISQSKYVYECAAQINEMVEGSKGEVLKDENGTACISQIELSSTGGTADAFSCDGSLIGTGMYIQGSTTNEEKATVSDLSSSLVKRSEELLQKLKSLEGSNGHLQRHHWTTKHVLEVEIRLSDFKSLVVYGSSLLPFWLHSERQLKRLKDSIDEEIYQIGKSQVDEVMATHISSGRGEGESVEIRQESEVDGNQNDTVLSTSIISKVSPNSDSLTGVEKDLCKEDSFKIAVHAENNAASQCPTRHLESGSIVGGQINGTVLPDESISKTEYHADEDVDMDVDMEVEDPVAAENTSIQSTLSAKDFAPQEQPVLPNQPADHPSLPSEHALAIPRFPPPPDDEWIPPPPPDNELVPPPPPDEPPELSYPPTTSYMENVQPLPYTDEYNLPYPDSSFAYYGHTVSEVSSNFYGHADESQVDASHTSIYYGAVPNTYEGTASVMVNPVASLAYYGLQDGTIPSVPVASRIEYSQNHSQSGRGSDTTASDRLGSVDTLSKAVTAVNDDVSASGGRTDMGSIGVPSTLATVQALATVSEKESIPPQSTNAVASSAAAATTSLAAKVQSKAGHNKRRTVAVAPSLRSNKKVSSLVDKWKAAKEELNENEEYEPENAYEILERKRQREIEEWHAQQIASGEANDNANFQPLGGDWREKVKRRRAQKAKEAAATPSKVQIDGNRQQQQPDLADLSRDLPSGWQAYWDETSKQVYYGNTITSETTWTSPTK